MLIRRFTVALLLLAQGLGLLHVALESHTEGTAGEWLDAALLHEDAHHGDAPHLCAPENDAQLAPSTPSCAVMAVWLTPAMISAAVLEIHSQQAEVTTRTVLRDAADQQDALSRAPKNSPPAA